VANQTLLGDELAAKVRECLLVGPCEFHVVVPATHVREHLAWTEGHDHVVAQGRLDEAMSRFGSIGADIDGDVGDARAIDAIGDALRAHAPFDEIIVSTLPLGLSRWLHQDLPHRVERAFHITTTVVTATRAVAA